MMKGSLSLSSSVCLWRRERTIGKLMKKNMLENDWRSNYSFREKNN
jgi:hypothetical protein